MKKDYPIMPRLCFVSWLIRIVGLEPETALISMRVSHNSDIVEFTAHLENQTIIDGLGNELKQLFLISSN